jgi:hypothetical protein
LRSWRIGDEKRDINTKDVMKKGVNGTIVEGERT